jgi:hypothetical protein
VGSLLALRDLGSTARPLPRAQRVAVAWIVLALSALCSAPSAASAAQAHAFSFSFGGAGSGAGQLSLTSSSGVAVNDETHDVYVADTGNNRVDEFEASSSSATFVRAWGWGVADGKTAALQVCEATCFKGLAGTGPGELEAPTFIAVDNDPASSSHGDVYVSLAGENLESPKNLVSKFDATGKLVESWGVKGQLDGSSAPEGPFGQPIGVAVDTSGTLWVLTGGTAKAPGRHTFQFGQEGAFKAAAPVYENVGASPEGISLDGSDDLYFVNGGSAAKLTPGETVFEPEKKRVFIGTVTGLAAAPATGDLYLDHAGSSIADVLSQCVPAPGGCIPAQEFGASQLTGGAGVAVDSAGVVYVANTAVDQVAVFGVSIEALIAAASEVKATSATLNGEVNPEGREVTKCTFQYGETKAYGKIAPCLPEPVGSGEAPVKVHADVIGLKAGGSYHYRLHVVNFSGEEIVSEDETTTTLPTAVIEEATTREVEPSSALLSAKINPKGVTGATCEIEYGTSTAYGTSVPCEPASLGSGTAGVAVSRRLEGLTRETTYHWRLIVKDENGTVQGPDNTFVYLPLGPFEIEQGCSNEALRGESNLNPSTGLAFSAELPDCRAYEMVSPPQKNGALLTRVLFGYATQIANEGDRVLTSSIQCFAQAQSCTGDRVSKGPPFEFARTSGGWQTHPLTPPASTFEVNSVWGYSADTGLVLYSSPVPSDVTDEFYARQPSGAMEPIGPIGEENAKITATFGVISGAPEFATSDLSHVVYEATAARLWSFDHSNGGSVYEYAGTGHTSPLLVGVSGGQGSTDLVSACGTYFAGLKATAVREAISSDGHIVYFTADGPCAGGTGVNETAEVPANELYARVDGEEPSAHSVLISARSPSECTEPSCTGSKPADAFMEGASEDGTKAFFVSTQKLTDSASEDATSGDVSGACNSTSGPNGCNLYLYDLNGAAGHNLIDVSHGGSSGLGPEVQGVMALSGDGSHVYFVAKGVLAGQNHAGAEPTPGADNLYVYQRDSSFPSGHTAFIATLPGDEQSTPRNEVPESDEWGERLTTIANVTVDGGVLLFTSHGALTADDTRGQGPAQVYRYEAASEELLRVSAGERGFNDNGNAGEGEAHIAWPNAQKVLPIRRDASMSSDGSLVFFQSPAGLTPGALNDVSVNGGVQSKDLAKNIYEWEAPGKGGCAQAGGCVHLISDGRDASEKIGQSSVELLGTDATAENVFFTTADPLVPGDTDTELDYYDARVRGGFPAPRAPAVCEGDGCRPEPPAPQAAGALGSLTFTGAGNVIPGIVKPHVTPSPALTRKQKLAKALKQCQKKYKAKSKKKQRAACEKQARKRYGPPAKKAKKTANSDPKGAK